MDHAQNISAVVLAAGRSQRMGQPKLLLPWDNGTVIGQVINVLREAGIGNIIVVTGAEHDAIAAALADNENSQPVHLVANPNYERTEMLISLQIGVRALDSACDAFLVVLGDQPTLTPQVVHAVVDTFQSGRHALVVPSYQMRRGHPWLVSCVLRQALLSMTDEQTPRDFLEAHRDVIQYIVIDAPQILEDMDTPAEYQRLRSLSQSSRNKRH